MPKQGAAKRQRTRPLEASKRVGDCITSENVLFESSADASRVTHKRAKPTTADARRKRCQSNRLKEKEISLKQFYLEIETIDMLKWFASRPKNVFVGRSESIQVQCGDLKSLRAGFVTEPILNLWCDSLSPLPPSVVIVPPDIFHRYLRGGLDQVRAWTDNAKIAASTVALFPIANGKLWDLIVLNPLELEAEFFALSGKEQDPQGLVEAAICLICNSQEIDKIWIDEALRFKTLYQSHTPVPDSRSIVCQYIEALIKDGPLKSVPVLKINMNIRVASLILSLVNCGMESLCSCGNDQVDKWMVACDNPYCKYQWFHLKTCTGLDKVPEGPWFCYECSVAM